MGLGFPWSVALLGEQDHAWSITEQHLVLPLQYLEKHTG